MDSKAKLLGHPIPPMRIVFALGLTGWLRVGIDTGAHLNAPNSLSGRLAANNAPDTLAKGGDGHVS